MVKASPGEGGMVERYLVQLESGTDGQDGERHPLGRDLVDGKGEVVLSHSSYFLQDLQGGIISGKDDHLYDGRLAAPFSISMDR